MPGTYYHKNGIIYGGSFGFVETVDPAFLILAAYLKVPANP